MDMMKDKIFKSIHSLSDTNKYVIHHNRTKIQPCAYDGDEFLDERTWGRKTAGDLLELMPHKEGNRSS
jgi:hypothetical protein